MNRQVRSSADETYLLGHTPAALQRLLVQGQMLNPFTRRVLEDAGITRGMKVLDVGCGPGDVSLMAADLVGETGSVLGIDSSPEPLRLAQSRVQEASLTQVSFRAGNILDVTLDQEFDAIVGRFILAHLPEPAAVVRHLTQYLRPGGVVVFQEYDLASHSDAFYPPSLILQFGIATEQDVGIDTLAERLRKETISRGGVARGPALVSAWVRKR